MLLSLRFAWDVVTYVDVHVLYRTLGSDLPSVRDSRASKASRAGQQDDVRDEGSIRRVISDSDLGLDGRTSSGLTFTGDAVALEAAQPRVSTATHSSRGDGEVDAESQSPLRRPKQSNIVNAAAAATATTAAAPDSPPQRSMGNRETAPAVPAPTCVAPAAPLSATTSVAPAAPLLTSSSTTQGVLLPTLASSSAQDAADSSESMIEFTASAAEPRVKTTRHLTRSGADVDVVASGVDRLSGSESDVGSRSRDMLSGSESDAGSRSPPRQTAGYVLPNAQARVAATGGALGMDMDMGVGMDMGMMDVGVMDMDMGTTDDDHGDIGVVDDVDDYLDGDDDGDDDDGSDYSQDDDFF